MINLAKEEQKGKSAENEILRFGNLVISLPSHSVEVAGQPIPLTVMEFDLLVTLASAPGRAFSRMALLERVWHYTYLGKSRTIDVHIATLRRKLKMVPEVACSIQTIRGIGYKFLPLSPTPAYS
jgi:DNA-binding response OmpR family regulator